MRVKVGSFKYEGGALQQTFQFRNNNELRATFDYEVHYYSGGKKLKSLGTYALAPGVESNISGAFVIGDAGRGISALITRISTNAEIGASAGRKTFNRPAISGFELEPGCIKLLKAESEKLELAGGSKQLMKWTPLITLVGENVPLHFLFFVSETSWAELAEAAQDVDRLALVSLAQDARNHANSDAHFGKPKTKQFWNAMSDFYYWQADRIRIDAEGNGKVK